jgi:peroxiredoxin (alkyl hydroperoxide reductase subunit C)
VTGTTPSDHLPPRLNDPAPQFRARSTRGTISLADYRGRWLVFFSHPADFTPVCTSELIGFAKAEAQFQALGCDLLSLSVDSLYAHLAWVRAIHERFGVTIGFPIVEDVSMSVARAYGMMHPRATDNSTVRSTFVIDPEGLIRAALHYPMNTGRMVGEVLRLVEALKLSDEDGVVTPEGWLPGGQVFDPAPQTMEDAALSFADNQDWYYRLHDQRPRTE